MATSSENSPNPCAFFALYLNLYVLPVTSPLTVNEFDNASGFSPINEYQLLVPSPLSHLKFSDRTSLPPFKLASRFPKSTTIYVLLVITFLVGGFGGFLGATYASSPLVFGSPTCENPIPLFAETRI